MKVIVLTGKSGGKMAESGDVTICIPSDDTQRIQEGHLLAEHILCESVEAGIMES
jgi:D-sedoheptulose 7-phosphate isomerase